MNIQKEQLIKSQTIQIGDAAILYVCSLPSQMQKQIRKEVIEKLRKIGCYSLENVERAMNSKLSDLADITNIRKYEDRQQEEKKQKDNEKENRGNSKCRVR